MTPLLLLLALQSHGDTPEPEAPKPNEEALEAIARFRVPEGFQVELFAAEPMVAHPVAFCFDALGRIYVAETFRHHKGVTDIRSHMDWLEDDLAIKTVEDRVAMFRKHEGEEGLAKGYSVEEDRVTRVVDTDGDGVADESKVFAGGFTDPAVGIGAGVIARDLPDGGAEVWFTCIPDVWILRDEDGDGEAESRESQSYGYGLRVALLGHDLHGLVVGPDGRMYFSIGDRGFNVTTREGKELVRYGMGAIFRCELDGSDLEIFCDGLRNPQELVFDDEGNLFTLDNNSDGGDQARWTWVLEGSDTGWRQAYQWVRDPVSRGPWNAELLWKPWTPEQPAYILPPIANITSGPSGLTMYPGTGWSEEWNGTFLVCDFRGNPGYSGITAFTHERDRSGFALVEKEEFVWDVLPTDCDFGPDGDLYWTDWVTGWNQTGKGRIYRLTPTELSDAQRDERATVTNLLRSGIASTGNEGLRALFGHADRRVRQRAKLEYVERALEAAPGEALAMVRTAWNTASDPIAQRQAHRAAWHVGRVRSDVADEAKQGLAFALAKYPNGNEVTLLRAAADLGMVEVASDVRADLESERFDVRLAAVEALGALGSPETDVPVLVQLLADHAGTDPWMRHACIHAIERLGSYEHVERYLAHGNVEVRRALTVVLRRWHHTGIARLLDDESVLVREEVARAVYDVPIDSVLPALAQRLMTEPGDGASDLLWRRMVHAARAAGDAKVLARFAVSDRGPESVRAEAVEVLARWTEPLTRDGIVMDHRPMPGGAPEPLAEIADTGITSVAFADAAASSARPKALQKALAKLHASLMGDSSAEALSTIARSTGADDEARKAAFRTLLDQLPDDLATQAVHQAAADDPSGPLAALSVNALDDARAAEALAGMAKHESAGVRREAVRLLGSRDGEACTAAFLALTESLEPTSPEWVEWLEAADAHGSEAVKAAAAARVAPVEGDPLAAWLMCLEGGDAERGKRIFETKSETTCLKCHVVGGEGGSEAGPVLDGLAQRLSRRQMLHSIVDPNAEIAEGFQSWLLRLTDGEVMAGRIVEETADLVVIEDNKKDQYEIEPSEIEMRKRDVSAMPSDVSTHLSRREMRDLIAFLSTL